MAQPSLRISLRFFILPFDQLLLLLFGANTEKNTSESVMKKQINKL